MIAAQNISLAFGGDPLFQDVNFMINRGDRVGLVGANGAGKTTMLRLLNGEMTPDTGTIAMRSGTEIGYLPQDGAGLSNQSVRDEVLSALGDLTRIEERMAVLNVEVAEAHDDPNRTDEERTELLEELGDLHHRYDQLDGFAARGAVEKILMGLGFEPTDLDRPCTEFSGGWGMRIALAKLLLREPDLLMLDEPTNHLDIESLTWLEAFLRTYHGAILLISHDRSFLDALTTHIYELSSRRLTIYTGNYTTYRAEREKRRVLQIAAYENQQKMIIDTERFIDRFRAKASKATQVQSRVKQLDKVERIEMPDSDEAEIHFRFPPAPRSGRVVVEMKHVTKRYGDNLVLENIDFALERGEKVAFLGRNGEGKSTLSRVIAGIEPFEGERIIGHNVELGYFAQHQAEELDPSKSVLQTLDDVAVGDIRQQLRSILGAFLFQGDDVFKPVSVLSGGEKSRLALAKLLLQPRNLLIFDEPTNHLDMASKGMLKKALQDFEGGAIIVSHDRDFLRGLVDHCVEFRNRKITITIGDIDEYLAGRDAEKVDDVFRNPKKSNAAMKGGGASGSNQKGGGSGGGSDKSRKDQKRHEAELRNKRHAATRELKEKLKRAERAVAETEEKKSAMETELADPNVYADGARVAMLQRKIKEAEERLTKLYGDWEKAAAALEAAEAEFKEKADG